MNNAKPLILLVCWITMIGIGMQQNTLYAQNRAEDATMEAVGKEDPFQLVRPIVEATRNKSRRVRRDADAQAAEEQIIVEEIPDLFIETVMLKFLQAVNLEPIVASLTSAYGTVAVDPETNSIIIADTQETIKRIVEQIRKADRTPQQVMIEVVIADVQLDDETEIGVNWANFASFGNQQTYQQDLVSTLAIPGTTGADFSFLTNTINVTLHALQQVRNVEILASPKVMVVSGEEATITTVEEIPYQELSDTSMGGSLTSTKFKEVGVTLTVTAIVTDDGKIKITAQSEQSVNTGRFGLSNQNSVPIINTRKASTTLLMNDGQVVVIGGLRSRNKRNTIEKIPLLGDLPLIGFLFSDDKVVVEHSELVVFLSPHIYKDEPLADKQIKRFNELKNSPTLEFPEHTRVEYEIMKKIFGVARAQ